MRDQNTTPWKLDGANIYRDGDLFAIFTHEWAADDYFRQKTNPVKEPRQEYWDDVREKAASIECELNSRIDDGENGETLREWLIDHIDESIDSAARIIYTRQAQECVMYSDNDGAYFDEFGDEGAVEDGAINWSRLAYSAFRADVLEQLNSIGIDVNNPGPKCEECGDHDDDMTKVDGNWYCPSCVPESEDTDTEEEEQ